VIAAFLLGISIAALPANDSLLPLNDTLPANESLPLAEMEAIKYPQQFHNPSSACAPTTNPVAKHRDRYHREAHSWVFVLISRAIIHDSSSNTAPMDPKASIDHAL
jgi:hypothetical protein